MKIVCDADGLIKMNKAGVLETLAKYAELVVGPDVFDEAVTEGKARGYPDAIVIEQIVKCHFQRKTPQPYPQVIPILQGFNLGVGEAEALALYFSENADAILSDDRGFLSILDIHHLPYLTPAALVVALCEWNILTIEKTKDVLSGLRPLIRDEQYQAALASLENLERN